METIITIRVNDKSKTKSLINFIKDLDYITLIETKNIRSVQKIKNPQKAVKSLTGIWKDRNITPEELRKKAWGEKI